MALKVDIVTAERLVYSEEGVERLIVPGVEGELGGLTLHAPLLPMIQPGVLRSVTGGAMAAALLVKEDCYLENVPAIGDVGHMAEVLRSLGAVVEATSEHGLRINAASLTHSSPPTELVGNLRASFLVMGALLARLGAGGCAPPGGGGGGAWASVGV